MSRMNKQRKNKIINKKVKQRINKQTNNIVDRKEAQDKMTHRNRYRWIDK